MHRITKRIRHRKKTNKRERVKETDQIRALKQNLYKNSPFYIVLLVCLFVLSRKSKNKSSFIALFISFLIASFYGYLVHIISHMYEFTKVYNRAPTLFKRISILNWLLKKFTYIADFHQITHHNSEINKKYRNLFLEAINNFLMQGGLIVIIGTIYNLLDWRVFIMWGVFYASVHIINYSIVEPVVHKDHHMNITSNYGIDAYDIIMGTKYNWTDIEEYNHYSINIIILTIIWYWFF